MEYHYKLEMRKPKSVVVRQWHEEGVYETQEAAKAAILYWAEYDTYYSLEGWEYQITQVKPRKRK